MHYEDIFFDEKSCIQRALLPVHPPAIPSPVRRYREYEIPGRDGKSYEDLETYDDIVLTIDFNFMTKDTSVDIRFREYRRFIRNAKTLQKSTDPDVFFKIKKVEISELDRGTARHIGTFTATFTLDPYAYLRSGIHQFPYRDILNNHYDLCHPIYIISGNGQCTLNVNGNQVQCNVGGTVYIDTHRELTYRMNGQYENTRLVGKYSDLFLKPGKNNIQVSKGFDLKAIPNWRLI